MSKVRVLYFAADPLSAPPDGQALRLLLDEDFRETQLKAGAARYGDALEIIFRPAARPDDLIRELGRQRPQVVHFSGHGSESGLEFVSPDGKGAHRVEPEALVQALEACRGEIRLVVLNACLSLSQAEAVAGVVGCAIGTRSEISDAAAITFSGSFYRAIASGESVQAAFDQARAAVALEYFAERDCPVLVSGTLVDPSKLFLINPGTADPTHAQSPTSAGPDTLNRPLPLLSRHRSRNTVVTSVLGIGGALLIAITPPPPYLRDPPIPAAIAPSSSGIACSPLPSRVAATDAATGTPVGMDEVISLFETGSYSAALARFKEAADRGDFRAQAYVGLAYLEGYGTERQPALAAELLEEAAKAGDPVAMNGRGLTFERGEGETRSFRWAGFWYERAGDEGNAPAMRNRANLYLRAQKADSAALWYDRAAQAGCLDAMVDLGYLYQKGLGTGRDLGEARRMYEMAASGGSPRGMLALGRMYQDGVGAPRDYAQAKRWYLAAKDAGSADAMNNLGVLYFRGWGVEQNWREALRWIRQARNAGSAIAAANLTPAKAE